MLNLTDSDDLQKEAHELSEADYVIPDVYDELYNHLKIYLNGFMNH